MAHQIATLLDLPPFEQVGIVVPDMDAALALYRPLFGEFVRIDSFVEDALYRGELASSEFKLAFARSGEIEIELIQWQAGPSPHKEFIDSGRHGVHHFRFRVDSLDDKLVEAEAVGYQVVWHKCLDQATAFAYIERPDDPLLIELLEMA